MEISRICVQNSNSPPTGGARSTEMDDDNIVRSVRQWVDSVVAGLNLCPFAKRELENNRVRFSQAEATTEEQLLGALEAELELLNDDSSIETTLLIHANVLQDFPDYNQFLNLADVLLVEMKLDGVYQVASFHPDYQFGGTDPSDAENYTNRSPYPLLHIIREESLERAIAGFPDIEQIPQRNIELLNSLGCDELAELLQSCYDDADN